MNASHIQLVTPLHGRDGQRTLAEALQSLRQQFVTLAEETDVRITSKPHITVVHTYSGSIPFLVAKCTAVKGGDAT